MEADSDTGILGVSGVVGEAAVVVVIGVVVGGIISKLVRY